LRATRRKEEIPFAATPLLCGFQQIVEGALWLSFMFDAPQLNVAITCLFSMFSHVLWPMFVPFSIGVLETVPWRRKVIWGFQAIGILVGLYPFYLILITGFTPAPWRRAGDSSVRVKRMDAGRVPRLDSGTTSVPDKICLTFTKPAFLAAHYRKPLAAFPALAHQRYRIAPAMPGMVLESGTVMPETAIEHTVRERRLYRRSI